MADLENNRLFTGQYSGLLSSLYTAGGLGGICLLLFECLRHIRRPRGREGPIPGRWSAWGRKLAKKRKESGGSGGGGGGGRGSAAGYWRSQGTGSQNGGRGEKGVGLGEKVDRYRRERLVDEREERVGLVEKVLGSRESWEFAYLYENRAWNAIEPAEPMTKWPLLWIWHTIMFPERDMPGRVGMDCTTHSRFLRGSLLYITLHVCTTMVILAPLHLFYAPDNISSESMNKAGISVSPSADEKRWLWVHTVLQYWMFLTWVGTLIWVIWGVLMYRKEEVRLKGLGLRNEFGGRLPRESGRLGIGGGVDLGMREVVDSPELDRIEEEDESQGETTVIGDSPTRLLPPKIQKAASDSAVWLEPPRSPIRTSSLRFEEKQDHRKGFNGFNDVNLDRADLVDATQTNGVGATGEKTTPPVLGLEAPGYKRYRTIMVTNIPPALRDQRKLGFYFSEHLTTNAPPPTEWKHAVPHFFKTQATRAQSFTNNGNTPRSSLDLMAHSQPREWDRVWDGDVECGGEEVVVEEVVLMAKLGEVGSLRSRREKVLQQLELAHVRLARRVIKDLEDFKTKKGVGLNQLPRVMGDKYMDDEILEGKRALLKALDPFLPSTRYEARLRGEIAEVDAGDKTIWEALIAVPREHLDPYQPLSHRIGALHDENLPLIDYLTAKLAVLTKKLEDAKAKPISQYNPSSTAFITFRTAELARRVLREMPSSVLYPLGCLTRPAPHSADLVYPRLSRSVYRADVLRGWIVGLLLFFASIVWIFPVSAFVALASVDTISTVLPGLANFLNNHPRLASFLTNTIPVLLVAALSLSICPLLLLAANRLETLITGYDVHNAVIHRNWIFLMVNAVIFFSVGRGGLVAYFSSRLSPNTILQNVANAFPSAAPYFATYFLLQTTIQALAELARVGLPLIFYAFSMRKAIIPRIRSMRIAHSTISYFIQLPNACLALTIANLFSIYNPLVLPFCWIYLFFANVVYKHNYLGIYGRRYENEGKRNCIRYIRFTLDGWSLTNFSILAFMILTKEKALAALAGILIPISIILKIGLTRLVKARFARLRSIEADQIDSIRLGKDAIRESELPEESKVWRWLASPGRFLDRYFTLKPRPDLDESAVREKLPVGSDAVTDTSSTESRLRLHRYQAQWDDLPGPSRMQAYEIQPWYHDPLETYLWLPRDPLSSLDLEDTVELRGSITTSEAEDIPLWENIEHVTEKIRPMMRERRGSSHSLIGSAVHDDDDVDDDPELNIVQKLSHRLVRLVSVSKPLRDEDEEDEEQEVMVNEAGSIHGSAPPTPLPAAVPASPSRRTSLFPGHWVPGHLHPGTQTPPARKVSWAGNRARARSVASRYSGDTPTHSVLLAVQDEENAAEAKRLEAEAKANKREQEEEQGVQLGRRPSMWKGLVRTQNRHPSVAVAKDGVN